MKIHNKLVRDKIPKIIEETGKTCSANILTNEEYIKALDAKLNEEVAEYQVDNGGNAQKKRKNVADFKAKYFWNM